jgi:hypothetical protein
MRGPAGAVQNECATGFSGSRALSFHTNAPRGLETAPNQDPEDVLSTKNFRLPISNVRMLRTDGVAAVHDVTRKNPYFGQV